MIEDGTFVVIEGLDSSGKRTQAELLRDRLKEEGEEARYVEFPTHQETPVGKVIDRYLLGEYRVPEEVRVLLYSADRYQFREEFEEFLRGGGVLVADRYSQSNYAFQTTEFDGEEWEDAVEWMEEVDSRLPRPDIVILLDIPPEKARKLMEEDGKEQDMHEEDIDFQGEVLENYRRLAEKKGWEVVEVVEDGEIRSKEEIHGDIWGKVRELL
ncbi:MAG: dTMP kinase [Candidatus Nanohaloarchaea archaeon]|nr:dTMP kinase [Candidatus Nanohaloarchaea archaeon]